MQKSDVDSQVNVKAHLFIDELNVKRHDSLLIELRYPPPISRITDNCEAVKKSCTRITGNDMHFRTRCFTQMGNMYSIIILSELRLPGPFNALPWSSKSTKI